MRRRPLAILLLLLLSAGNSRAQFAPFSRKKLVTGTQTTVTLTPASGTTWSVPSTVTKLDSVECWGGGGGIEFASGASHAAGAGGGAYSKIVNVPVRPNEQITFKVGAGGASNSSNPTDGGDSYFGNSTFSLAWVAAKGGLHSVRSVVTGAAGGQASAGIGSVKWSGGTGGNSGDVAKGAGAGGGAGASPTGNGGNGANSDNAGTPGKGGDSPSAGAGGAGGVDGVGQQGTDNTNGGGGGGGGDYYNDFITGEHGYVGGRGGIPGGGAGAAGDSGSGTPGNGGNGQIIIRYTP